MGQVFRTAIAAAALFFAATVSAQAVPVKWTLKDAEFRFGGTATGGFVHDFVNNSFSAVNIVTTNDPATGLGTTYSNILAGAPSTTLNFLEPVSADLTGASRLVLLLDTLLTPFGGTIALAPSSGEGRCVDQFCNGLNPDRVFTGGSIVGVQIIPLPAPAFLLLSALAGLGLLARHRI